MAGSTIAAIVIAEIVGLSPKWENACVYTVILFAVVIVALRPAWGRAIFWWRLAGVFVLHVIIMTTILEVLPATSQGLYGIPMIVSTIAESLLIGSILWR